jgi:hypothetical protein
MSFRVFDTQFGVQGMENISEIWYCLVPFLMQRGPSCVLVLVASNMVVLFFKGKLVPQLLRVLTFSYDLRFRHVIAHWKGIFRRTTHCVIKL